MQEMVPASRKSACVHRILQRCISIRSAYPNATEIYIGGGNVTRLASMAKLKAGRRSQQHQTCHYSGWQLNARH